MRRTPFGRVVVVVVAVLVTACADVAPTAADRSRPDTYVVRQGETLYAIATRFGIDYHDLARWNRLGDGSLIYPGQRLVLRPATAPPMGSVSRVPDVAPPALWQWPADGTLALRFRQSPKSASGILISGAKGEAVRAAAEGDVVYAGSGLTGYGQLVIVRHNAAWLSAYGHNDELLVGEGEHVRSGQEIAKMGAGAGYPAALHFEIRRDGEPVDPLLYLPPRP